MNKTEDTAVSVDWKYHALISVASLWGHYEPEKHWEILTIINDFYIVLFSDLHKLTVLYNKSFVAFSPLGVRNMKGSRSKKVMYNNMTTNNIQDKIMYILHWSTSTALFSFCFFCSCCCYSMTKIHLI